MKLVDTYRQICYAHIIACQSQVDYFLSLSPSDSEQQVMLQRIQNNCSRFFFSVPVFYHITNYRRRQGWASIEHRVNLAILCTFYKTIHLINQVTLEERYIFFVRLSGCQTSCKKSKPYFAY